ncbi:hypothetical protein HJC23_007404 [Cyclotella cryptica]|uniref:MPN domain-containing protein n=1 Tax=Cyclotella cryptica TaxID=29204 RepID=A0ABD3QK95_9STRA
MALHSARHGFSNPIHGILLGQRSAALLQVTDVLPVCHEVPTKPIVDMALRFADIYVQQTKETVEIVGWYTANANVTSSEKEALPNVSACRVVSSMAEQINNNEGLVLVLLSSIGVCSTFGEKEQEGKSPTPLFTVFEKDGKTRTFTQNVDASRVVTKESTKGEVSDAILQALTRMSKFSSEYDEPTTAGELIIYDFVDHITDFEKREDLDEKNWIENKAVVEFVDSYLKAR